MVFKTLLISSAIAGLVVAFPTTDAHAGNAGKFIGGALLGAAIGYGVHKAIKNNKKNGKRRNTRYRGNKSSYSNKVRQVARQDTINHQTWLTELGYNPGIIDGLSGKKTKRAIRAFQKDYGFAPTGRLTTAQENSLQQAVLSRRIAQTQPHSNIQVGSSSFATAPSVQPNQGNTNLPPAIITPPVVAAPIAPQIQAAPPVVPSVTIIEPQTNESVVAQTPRTQPAAVQDLGSPGAPSPSIVEPIAPAIPNNVVALEQSKDTGQSASAQNNKPAIFGLIPGGDFADTRNTLEEKGFGQCDVAPNGVFCEKETGFGKDSIAVAAMNGQIHTINRKMTFNSPISTSVVFKKMPASYGQLIQSSNHTIASSPACDAVLSSNGEIFSSLIRQGVSDQKLSESALQFSKECTYYFKIEKPAGEHVQEISLTFFDAQSIVNAEPKLSAAIVEELKF